MFKTFFKTTVGMKDKCGGEKTAEGSVADSMKAAFKTPTAPTPAPAPADVSADSGGSLGSRITAGVKSLMGGG